MRLWGYASRVVGRSQPGDRPVAKERIALVRNTVDIGPGLSEILHANFYEKVLFVKADVEAPSWLRRVRPEQELYGATALFVFSNGIPIEIKSAKALVVRI